MANGQRAAPAVPLSPCVIHEKGVEEGVADRRDAPGRTASETHSAHCGAASHRCPPTKIHRGLCKKSGIFCSYMRSAVKKKAMIWIADHEDLTLW